MSKKLSSNDVNAQEWLNTLGGFGVTLNIEGNPYIPSSNAYLSSFLEHADSVASQEIRSVLEANIKQNNHKQLLFIRLCGIMLILIVT